MGVSINRAGFCKCPFHPDKDASMKVYTDPNRGYHCFGCHVGGDVVNLAMRWYGLPFREALTRAANDFGVILPDEKKVTSNQRRYAEIHREIVNVKRELADMQRKEAERAYWAAFDAWWKNDKALRWKAPQSPLEPFSAEWCEAVRRRDELTYNLNIAEERRDVYYARK